jgi:hypothetical protein
MRPGLPEACMIVAEVPGLDHAGVPLDVTDIPDQPVRVRIPAAGRLAVEVWHGGTIAALDVRVTLSHAFASPLPRTGAPRSWLQQIGTGRVAFSPVGLGGRVRVQAVVGAVGLPLQEGPGPLHPGEEVTFRFELDKAQPILEARLVDEAGMPRPRQALFLSMDFDDERITRFATATDSSGLLQLVLDDACSARCCGASNSKLGGRLAAVRA